MKLDIDYTEEIIFPVVETYNLPYGKGDRKIDAFSAFEDAGLKLIYKKSDCQQVHKIITGLLRRVFTKGQSGAYRTLHMGVRSLCRGEEISLLVIDATAISNLD